MNEKDWLRKHLSICALCGRCKQDCPTYNTEHNEARGPRGRLLLLYEAASGNTPADQTLIDRVFSCLLCGACGEVCPSGVDIMGALLRGRSMLKGHDRSFRLLRPLATAATKSPLLSYRFLTVFKELIGPVLIKKGLLHPGLELDFTPLHKEGTVFQPSRGKKIGRVVLFTGCAVRYLYPYLGKSLITVLNTLGYEVVIQKKEYCCGAPLLGLGLLKKTEELAYKNYELFKKLKADALVTLCPTCTMVGNGLYKRLFGISLELINFDDFIVENHLVAGGLSVKAFYHQPCHLRFRPERASNSLRLLKEMGVEVTGSSQSCCGHAGTYSIRFKEQSKRMLDDRVNEFNASKADVLLTSCPGCIFQLSKAVPHDRVLHTVEVVEEAIGEDQS